MLILKKVAITGGLSCGKSTVCKLLKDRGAFIVSADEIVHQLLSPTNPIGKKIVQLLGDEIIKDGTFDKKKIAKLVFENRETLKALEHILHPAVLAEVEKQYQSVKENPEYRLFIAEIPLLYEIESAHLFDVVIAVTADESLAKKRFEEKTNQEFEKRMTHQMPIEEKCAKADYTLTNNGDLAQLEKDVTILYNQLT